MRERTLLDGNARLGPVPARDFLLGQPAFAFLLYLLPHPLASAFRTLSMRHRFCCAWKGCGEPSHNCVGRACGARGPHCGSRYLPLLLVLLSYSAPEARMCRGQGPSPR